MLVGIAVILTRVTGFEPGLVFGLVLGLSFAVELSRLQEARLALAASGYALVLGIAGWLIFSVLVAWLGSNPGWLGLFAQETASGLAVSCLTALPIALLPLAVLDGGVVFAWKRWVWAIAYLVALTAFLLIVLPLPASWDDLTGTHLAWLVLFVAYCVLALAVWAIFRFWVQCRDRRSPDEQRQVVEDR